MCCMQHKFNCLSIIPIGAYSFLYLLVYERISIAPFQYPMVTSKKMSKYYKYRLCTTWLFTTLNLMLIPIQQSSNKSLAIIYGYKAYNKLLSRLLSDISSLLATVLSMMLNQCVVSNWRHLKAVFLSKIVSKH